MGGGQFRLRDGRPSVPLAPLCPSLEDQHVRRRHKDFLANPVGWMRNNQLIIDIQTGGMDTRGADRGHILRYDQGAPLTRNIDRDPSRTAQMTGGGSRQVCRVKETTGMAHKYAHRFQAYYLPFFSNAFRTMRLDRTLFPPGADSFFTDTVNGCSFATRPGQNPKVGHFNRTVGGVDSGAAIDQATMNNAIAAAFGMGTDRKLTRSACKPTATCYATSFRTSNNTAWDLFWQSPREWVGVGNGEKEFKVPVNMLHQCDNNR